MNNAKVIGNNGAEVKLGFEDGSFRTVPAGDLGFLAPVGMAIDVYKDEAGNFEYVQHQGGSSFGASAGGIFDKVKDNLTGKTKVNKVTYVLLAALLGGGGFHKLYAGKYVWFAIYLLFCWTYIPMIVSFIEMIMAAMKNADADGRIEV